MAKLEIQLGADSAELLRELSASEKMLKDWVSRVGSLKPKFSSTGLVEYSKETKAALEVEAVALAKATSETQQFKAAQAAAAAETAKFRNEKNTSSKAITENSRLYKQLSQRLTEVRKNAQDVGAQFGVNSAQFARASEAVNRLDGRLKSIDSALGVNTRRVGAYGNALQSSNAVSIEFARIIQDAPFGIIGVGNNITQLTSNYAQYAQSVRAAALEQGKQVTSGSILKGALQGLLTPASLLTLGISAVTSGLTLYTMWSQRSAKASRDAAKEAKKAGEDYISSLDGITQARYKGEQGAISEMTTLKNLYRVYTDGNENIKTRKAAYDQLQQLYPEYFKNIEFERITSDKTRLVYDKLTTSILATARARAAENKITENSNKILEAEYKLRDLQAQLIKSRSTDTGYASAFGGSQETRNIEQQIFDIAKGRNELRKENLFLETQVNKQLEKGAKLNGSIGKGSGGGGTSEVESRAKKIADVYRNLNAELQSNPLKLNTTIMSLAKDDVSSYEKAIEALVKLGFDPASEAIQKLLANINELGKVLGSQNLEARVGIIPTLTPASINDTRLKDTTGKLSPAGVISNATQNDPYIQRAIRSSISGVISNTVSGLSSIGQKNYDIEKKYSDMRIGATQEQIALYTEMERLEKSVSTGLLSTITNVFNSLSTGITDIFIKGFSDKLSKSINDGEFQIGGLSSKISQALVAGAGLAGGLISGISSPTSIGGQGLGGLISGAGTGAALGSVVPGIGTLVGAIGGGLLGAIGGIFGASKAKKQEELQKQQLEVQKKQLAEQQRANALAYSSSIIGQMTNQGLITGIDRDAFGNIVGKIQGQDLLLIIDRTRNSR